MADLYLTGKLTNSDSVTILDEYESLIWTERYQAAGDFVLVLKELPSLMRDLRQYKYLRLSASKRIMMIEKIETKAQEDGANLITIKGRSFEAFLETRSNKTVTKEAIYLEDNPAAIAIYFVERYCVNPNTTALHNVIPGLTIGPNFYTDEEKVGMKMERGEIYGLVKDACVSAGLGFKIEKNGDNLVFSVYRGTNRMVSDNSIYREYSPDAENLHNPSSIESIEKYRNNARVIGFKDIVDVFTPGTPDTVSGLERRTVVVEAREIGDDDDPSTRDEQLRALAYRGYQALADANNRYSRLIDGDVPPLSWDEGFFNLGDIVVVGDYYGSTAKMFISEQIWSLDATGERLIPTFQEL
jgi:hypothetical protein